MVSGVSAASVFTDQNLSSNLDSSHAGHFKNPSDPCRDDDLATRAAGRVLGDGREEAKNYKLVDITLPNELAIEAGSFEVMPDKKRLAIGTRRGDIFLADGAFDEHPEPKFHKFASGLDGVFGMAYRDGSFLVTQQTEVTRITDCLLYTSPSPRD